MKLNKKVSKILRGVNNLFLFSLLILTACETPSEGCLDLRATNYDVAARKNCTDCCQFPQLQLSIGYKYGDSNFVDNRIYYTTTTPRDSFKIDSVYMYFSDFQLVATDGKTYSSIDSVFLIRRRDTVRALNSFVFMEKDRFSYDIGTFSEVGKTFNKVRFKLGLNDTVKLTNANRMSAGHPLSKRPDSLNLIRDTLIVMRMKIYKGIGFKDTVTIQILSPTKQFELAANLKTIEGFNAVIPLRINYLELIKGVNFSSQQTVIQQKVVDNLVNIFSIQK